MSDAIEKAERRYREASEALAAAVELAFPVGTPVACCLGARGVMRGTVCAPPCPQSSPGRLRVRHHTSGHVRSVSWRYIVR